MKIKKMCEGTRILIYFLNIRTKSRNLHELKLDQRALNNIINN